jgi:predicted TIM-barrel fold metal-dependent hydrolase
MEATLAEVRWAADHGFRGITAPCAITDSSAPPIFDRYYEPFWQTCAELDLVISLHAGHGSAQGSIIEFFRGLMKESRSEDDALARMASGVKGSPFAPTLVPTQVLYSLMLAGIFDRYPDLHFSLTEVRSDWVPATLALLDRRFERGDTPLEKPPSEYWSAHCFVGASSIKKSEVRLRHAIGTSRMMFGRDYPHAEGTWPNTWDWLRDVLVDYSEAGARALLGENAARCYRLDEVALRAVGDRIGPRIDDLLGGGQPVDPRLVENFAQRAGYEKSYEEIDAAKIEKLFDLDLAALSEATPS